MDIPFSTSVIVGPWSVYSCKTSNHDDRCLVIKDCRSDSPSTICLHHLCKQARAVLVNSSSYSLFTCEHVKTIESAVQPQKRYFDFPDLQGYQCDDTIMQKKNRRKTTKVKHESVNDSEKSHVMRMYIKEYTAIVRPLFQKQQYTEDDFSKSTH